MRVDELDFALPRELIAQRPLERRELSRMLCLGRESGIWDDRRFEELPELLRGDELIVLNNTRVLPARLFGRRVGIHSQPASRTTKREHLSGTVEVFLVSKVSEDVWQALVRPGRKLPVGERISFHGGELEAEILKRGELGLRTIRFEAKSSRSISALMEESGHVPLPPYIDRADDSADRERYQTVFARVPGAVAAPTAGLHFTAEILERIKSRGCQVVDLTLEVGLGTFQPVHSETFEGHPIHAETYEIDESAAVAIQNAKKASRPVLAIGTTVVRALEDAAQRAERSDAGSVVSAGRAQAEIFILPGHRFRIVDGLLTNFHLPKSTLLALVAAFAGRDAVLKAYAHAVREKYRFYSYGDCMLIR